MRVVLPLLLLLAPVSAQDDLDKALSVLRTASHGERAEAVRNVLALKPKRDDVVARLKAGVPVKMWPPGWHMLEATASDGEKRPYQLYIPKPAEENEPMPLLVHMHGGVARADFGRVKGKVGYGGVLWPELAEQHKFVIAFPEARSDCMWWSDAGVAHVRAVIREAKRFAPIDDDAIVGTGFSDGGSGCYYLAMAAPDPFAAFLPMNGHPAVGANASGKQLYVHNLVGSPLFCAMTSDDQLYPAGAVLPHLAPALALGAKMHIVNYPTGGHQPVYFKEQTGAFMRFLADTPRDPSPMDLEWRCADPKIGRYRWVEVLEIGATEGDAAAATDINVMSTPSRVRLGIQIDRNFAEAVRITLVVEKSVAAAMGIEQGDFLVALDGRQTPNIQALRIVLAAKKYGDEVTATVKRGLEELALKGRFPEFKPSPYYKRGKPTARITVTVEDQIIHVTSRNVKKFKLYLPPILFGAGPVTVKVNGREAKTTITQVALKDVLVRYAADADARRLATREAVVEVGGDG